MHVLIIDDHDLFRKGLQFLLSDLVENIRFSEADGVEDLLEVDADPPDLVLLDLKLRGTSGGEALSRVRRHIPNAMVVALSSEEDPNLIRDIIDGGAAGFIPKATKPEVLIPALRLILAGGIYLPPQSSRSSDSSGRVSKPSNVTDRLTDRQLAALMLAVKGFSNKAIAREMNIAEGTVKLHLSAAYRILGVSNRTEAVFDVAAAGLLPDR